MTQPLPATDMPRWQNAACKDADPDLFFPRDRDVWWKTVEASTYCDRCPLRRACLAYALTHDVAGIWAGTTHEQRRRIRRAHGIEAEPLLLSDLAQQAAEAARIDRGGFRR